MQFSVSKLHNWQAQTSIYEKNRRVIITRFTDSISIFWRVIAQSTIDMGWHKVVILIYWALGGRKNAKHINERVHASHLSFVEDFIHWDLWYIVRLKDIYIM